MSGNRYFLDTNAIVQLLAGNDELLALLGKAEYVATSIICELEFFSYSGLPEEDKMLFRELRERIRVIDLCSGHENLNEQICQIRMEKQLKLPDAIILASSITEKCTLLTADKKMLSVGGEYAQSYELI